MSLRATRRSSTLRPLTLEHRHVVSDYTRGLMTEISVVIPTKDRLPYLRKAIPMFLGTDEVKEVVVVVDGCTDGTLAYIQAASESDPRIRYTDNVVNRGLPYSRNR